MPKEQEAGAKTADVCRKQGISAVTFYKFTAKLGSMDVSDAHRLKTLEECPAEETAGRADAGQCDPEGRHRKNMVAPGRKAVAQDCESERRAWLCTSTVRRCATLASVRTMNRCEKQ